MVGMILGCSFATPGVKERQCSKEALIIGRKMVIMRSSEVQRQKQRQERMMVIKLEVQGSISLGEID